MRRGRASGRLVVLVGPDGSGKTTVARELLSRFDGPSGYFHFRPPVRPPLAAEPLALRPVPKVRHSGSRALGWLRLLRSFVLFWVGFIRTVRPALEGGTLVVGDRWVYGYLVQPAPLRFQGPQWLAVWAIRALPQPDLVVNLTAPVEVILERKQELSSEEVAAELSAWSSLPLPQLLTLDASRPVSAIVADIEKALSK